VSRSAPSPSGKTRHRRRSSLVPDWQFQSAPIRSPGESPLDCSYLACSDSGQYLALPPLTLLRSRRLEPHRHRVAALPDRPLQANTVGVKHVAPIPTRREEGVEVNGRDGLSDLKGVGTGWRSDPQPV
jgi:hypothetical protein